MEADEAYLAHYGVLGMKWGVRRTQAQLDRAAGRRKVPDADKKKKMSAETKKKVAIGIGVAAGTLAVAGLIGNNVRLNNNLKKTQGFAVNALANYQNSEEAVTVVSNILKKDGHKKYADLLDQHAFGTSQSLSKENLELARSRASKIFNFVVKDVRTTGQRLKEWDLPDVKERVAKDALSDFPRLFDNVINNLQYNHGVSGAKTLRTLI